jgi:cephalosporin-C deacetylase
MKQDNNGESTALSEGRQPPLSRTDDFDEFWRATLAELSGIPANIQFKTNAASWDELVLEWLTFQSLGGAVIHGYRLVWRDDKPRSAVVHSHGYVGAVQPMWQWARRGLNVVGFDIRGCGRSRHAVSQLSSDGYILTGIESPSGSIMRGAICDYVRAAQVARQCLAPAPGRMVFHGFSFSAALALDAAALGNDADFLVAQVPTLGWAEGRRRLVKRGSGAEINAWLRKHPDKEKAAMRVLSYFDTMNFADRVSSPALVGLGLQDDIVPAETVYPIVSRLQTPYRLRCFPYSHSQRPEEAAWEAFENEWLHCANLDKKTLVAALRDPVSCVGSADYPESLSGL